MATPAELLAQSLAKLRNANRIKSSTSGYRKDNPTEYAKVIAYLDGGARPSGVTTDMGMGLMLEEDARRALAPPPPPTGNWTKVADEGVAFTLSAAKSVRYGVTGNFTTPRTLGPGTFLCENSVFGDPAPGATKRCEVLDAGPPPPPPPTGNWEGPITVTQGGTITGRSFESTSTFPASINTDQPVVFNGCRFRRLSGGDLIRGQGFQLKNVTFDHCQFFGGTGRIFDAIGVDRLIVRNCTTDKTSGMKITESHGVTQILLTKNKHRNIQHAALSQFSQFGEVDGNIEISWNEIINDPDVSQAEDVLSIYKSSGMHVFDNYIQGQWNAGNSPDSSQNGITIESPDSGMRSTNNLVERNQVIACMGGIGMFTGDNNQILNNRIVRSGYYPDGVTKVAAGYSGLDVQPGGGSNNHAHGNLVGYVSGTKHGFGRTDWGILPAHCEPLNTHYPGTVTRASEQAEWDFWVAKLAANGITVGA